MKQDILIERFVTGPLEVNTYLLSDLNHREKPAAIIDPGEKSEPMVSRITELGLNPVYIINTHGHIDHTGFNRWFKDRYGCPILIHKDDAMLIGKKQDEYLFTILQAELSPKPDRMLDHRDTITIGSLNLEVIHTPGHSMGSICLKADDFVLTGDTIFKDGVGRTDLFGGSYEMLMESIQSRLLNLPEETIIYPGHGEPSTIAEETLNNPFLQL